MADTKVAGTKAKKAGKAAKKVAGKKGTPGAVSAKAAGTARAAMQAMRIRLLAKENPKRPGTGAHERWQLYKNGMTVQEFLEAAKAKGHGHPSSDVRYGVKHKFLELY